jgi:23S rRNA (guanosine2251-2'-O)-methyltransferase
MSSARHQRPPRPRPRNRTVRAEQRTLYGIQPLREMLRAAPDRISKIFILVRPSGLLAELAHQARRQGIRVEHRTRQELETMVGGAAHQGAVALAEAYRYVDLQDILDRARHAGESPLVLVLDGVQDPGNLGSLLRSAQCFGVHGVVLPRHRAASVTPAVTKRSAGASEWVPTAQVTNISQALAQLKQEGLWIGAAQPDARQPAWTQDLSGPLALVIGSEGRGVRPLVRRSCDLELRIPMCMAAASLNAAVAGAVLLYEISRQRALSRAASSPLGGN